MSLLEGAMAGARGSNRPRRTRAKESARARILLLALIGAAILLILLRLAEFAGHRMRPARPGAGTLAIEESAGFQARASS